MSSSPLMMIGAYVSYEVIASSATFQLSRKRKWKNLLHDLLGIPRSMYARATLRTSRSRGGCGLAGRKLRMQPEEATVKCRLV
ncbi:hypothetical protein BDV30DRAFT_201925 [Aspergillus minisclerotigenes]|uniref:Uncharacterized protein n=1 Tax=Aspergillus minisclerotigenes TaxID=656917 RepID=A0A5N6JL83_9EURO|nr:hypothetical protein BDV30DRAFT_201925 [Aspergillus minisclerotigenes]